ncbi:MAG: CCA tRNA nucleotidyltransferase [Candidatus Melainabacteria bacterium]|nr:CCA tRNA nucleotidyltransferase [Candidatus Melainabacteria bacterium]
MLALPFAKSVVKRLVDAGHIAYFAGGWVRDFLLKHPSDDIDIATTASVAQIQALFPKTIPVGVAFGIVIVVEEGHQFEVATFRKESGYLDGRRPTSIEPSTPEEDAQRRDFTINGMFWDPLKEILYDFVGGQKDLKLGIIRAIGDPHERFLEDRLRMMRGVRYSTRFNFPIDVETTQAILAHAQTLLPAVAMERVWQEFKKMSQFAHFDKSLISLHELNLLPTIFPDLKNVSTQEIKDRLKALPRLPKNTPAIAELLELFPEYSLEQLLDLCEHLKLSRKEREMVEFLHHSKQMLRMPQEWLDKLEKFEWAQFYANPLSEISLSILAAHKPKEQMKDFLESHQKRQGTLKNAIERIQTQNPVVRSDHLVHAGIKPGKQMGALLKEAERVSVNENSEDPVKIIQLLKKSPLWNT